MPSVTTPPADGGGTPSLPELAAVMQEDGTREENATILNLYLSGSDLLVGAPSPISAAQTTEPAGGLVFNNNFTRERYGKAAVSDNITLEADRRSLLLDSNQTNEQKAISILAALEFDNGLSAVQSMSEAEVTGTSPPDNIDFFSRRPVSMYRNTQALDAPKRDHLMASFTGEAEPEFIDSMVSKVGGDTAKFATFADVTADQTIMQSIAGDEVAIRMLSSHPNGAQKMAQSQTALDAVGASQTAKTAVAASQVAVSAIENASTSASGSIPITNTASFYVAEITGGGGGGYDAFEGRDGSDGTATTFHQLVAEGGAGSDSPNGEDGDAIVSSPDEPVKAVDGGANNGGDGRTSGSGSNGGDGALIKALVINPEQDALTLTVGSGGAGGGLADGGGDGSATIFTPNVFS